MEPDKQLEKILKKKLEEIMGYIEQDRERTETILVYNVTDDDFKERVIEKSKEVLVLVDFWAEWCAPCLMLSPILEKVVTKLGSKVVLAKLNVDENPVTSQRYGVMSIPTVILFKDSRMADQFVGLIPEEAIVRWLKRYIT